MQFVLLISCFVDHNNFCVLIREPISAMCDIWLKSIASPLHDFKNRIVVFFIFGDIIHVYMHCKHQFLNKKKYIYREFFNERIECGTLKK